MFLKSYLFFIIIIMYESMIGNVGGAAFIDNAKNFLTSRTGMITLGCVIVLVIIIIMISLKNKEGFIGPTIYDSKAMYGDHGYKFRGTQPETGPNGEDWGVTWANDIKKKHQHPSQTLMHH